MSRWFRMYDCLLDDPKVQRLPERFFKVWVNVLCVASRNDGVLPPIVDLAFMLRMSVEDAEAAVAGLEQAGLIDREQDIVTPHKWAERQYKSDTSTERVKRFRERSTKQPETVSVTPPDTESDTEQKQIQSARAPSEVSDFRKAIVDAFTASGSITIPDTSRASIWLERGWKPAICLAVIGEILARKPSVGSLGYFERAIADAHVAPVGQAKTANGYKSPVTPDKRIWLPQGSEGYEAWRTAFPGVVKATLTTKGKEQGVLMPTEFPPKQGAAA